MTTPMLWISSENVALGPYSSELVDLYWRWEQDPGLIVGFGRQSPVSLETRTEGMAAQARGSNIRFTIYDTTEEQPEPVGVTELLPDHAVRTAEFIIMLAPEARGRRIATRATRLTLDYAFHITNLRMVHLKVLSPNTAAVRAYERAGFRHAGVLRQSGYWLGEVCDELVMDALASEFSGPSAIKAQLSTGQH